MGSESMHQIMSLILLIHSNLLADGAGLPLIRKINALGLANPQIGSIDSLGFFVALANQIAQPEAAHG